MDLSFTEEQEILRKSAANFLVTKLPKKMIAEIEKSDAGYSAEIWKEMAELGWMGLPFPEEYGGAAMTFVDMAVLLEEMGKACLPAPYLSTVILGGFSILDFGTDEQKDGLLKDIASGKLILTLGLSEPDSSYSIASTRMKAVPDGDAWTIDGTKLFVPFANTADYILCVARTNEIGDTRDGLTIFLVDAKEPAVNIETLDTIADRLCEVTFNKVKVNKGNVLGKVNHGWEILKKVINRAEVALCCQMAGMAQQVLDMTVDYAKERKQFDRPIGSFQIIQHYCADMFVDVEGIKLSSYHAAWKLSEGLDCDEEVATAKTWAIQAADRIVNLAHQVFGAIGVTMDYDLHYYTRRLKASELSFGNVNFYREFLAEDMGL